MFIPIGNFPSKLPLVARSNLVKYYWNSLHETFERQTGIRLGKHLVHEYPHEFITKNMKQKSEKPIVSGVEK